MFIFSFERRRGVKLAAILVFAAFLTALCVFVACERRDAVKGFASSDEIGRYSTEAGDTDARLEFLSTFGIKAERDSESSDTVRVPNDFNDVYTAYNNLQKAIGLNLEPFRGESVSRITYKIMNSKKTVTLLCFKARVIGGHISTGVYGDGYLSLGEMKKYGKTG